MAKLNPPSISGTLPSFYNSNGTVDITVPFSMNKTVSFNEVWGFSLRIKTTNTDTVIGIVEVSNMIEASATSYAATFKNLDHKIINKLIAGQSYKIQLAYIGYNTAKGKGVTGYYSSIGIAKFTAEPQLSISGLSIGTMNANTGNFIGEYSNAGDPTEKVYQYKFTIYNAKGEEVESSGWLLHNTYTDENSWSSMDEYVLRRTLEDGILYKVRYSVITNNNLELQTPRYSIMQAESVDPTITAKLHATLDYENACVTIGMTGSNDPKTGKEAPTSGAFILVRASSDTGFNIWTVIHDFRLKGQVPSSFLFRDFTIEQGTTYRYALQQYNDAKIYSNRLYAEDVLANFEDAYLYDGQRQLRIRFNPKVSSFKTNYLDTKKTTLGSQYPFIFRNGTVAYKEFPINGLLSYAIDNDEFFISYSDDLLMPKNWQFTTDIIDENITYERRFKLEVLDWLNNGEIKLFKSPTEGNYLVRLMNVNLTPVDQTSRMLHNFSCTANEVAAYTVDNLATYDFLHVETTESGAMRWSSVVLSDFVEEYYSNPEKKPADAMTYDLLKGLSCYHVQVHDAMPGTQLQIGDLNIVIGITGSYEVRFETPVKGLYIKTVHRKMPGIITFGVYSTTTNAFDQINKINIYDIPLLYLNGPQEDIFAEYVDTKHMISRMYFARFSGREIVSVPNRQSLELYLWDGSFPNMDALNTYQIYFTTEDQKYYQFIGRNEALNWDLPMSDLTQIGQELRDSRFYSAFSELHEYSTEIIMDNVSLSVEQNNEIVIPELTTPPQHISIGNGVLAEIAFQVKEITYTAENNLYQVKQDYLDALELWRAQVMDYEQATPSQVTEKTSAGYVNNCYYFENNSFRMMLDTERAAYDAEAQQAWTDRNDSWDSEIVRQSYEDYKIKHKIFIEALDEALAEQEVEMT